MEFVLQFFCFFKSFVKLIGVEKRIILCVYHGVFGTLPSLLKYPSNLTRVMCTHSEMYFKDAAQRTV